MHESVVLWANQTFIREEFAGKLVVESGSYQVNGGLRGPIEQFGPAEYIGTDMRPGPGVDAAIDAVDLAAYFSDVDVVVSSEMLEHCADWRGAINAMKTILKPGGLIYLTARGPGYPPHDYPSDHWRFSPEKMAEIFADFDIEICIQDTDPNSPGFFLKAWKPKTWKPLDLSKIEAAPVIIVSRD